MTLNFLNASNKDIFQKKFNMANKTEKNKATKKMYRCGNISSKSQGIEVEAGIFQKSAGNAVLLQ